MRSLSDIIYHQRPLTLRQHDSVQDACRQMSESRCGSVLITNEVGRLLGIFTGRDAVSRVLAKGKDPSKTSLVDVMTKDPITMPSGRSAIDALRLMWDGGFRHLPVVDAGKIVGIVSRGDFKGYEQNRLDEERELWDHMR